MTGRPVRISERSRNPAVVDSTVGPIMAKVRVDIGGGNIITAIVTADAVNAMGFDFGDEISVVIKATEVMLAK